LAAVISVIIVPTPFSVGLNARKPIMLPIEGNHTHYSGLDEMEQGAFSCRHIC
jgi:hypothetical protein